MLRYILRRLAGAVVVMLALSFLVFSLLYLVPGDPVKILVGTRRLTPDVRQAVTARYGLDEPLLLRYWHWLTRALTGDFGDSVRSATPRHGYPRLPRLPHRVAHHRSVPPGRRRRHPPGNRCRATQRNVG